MFNLRKSRKLSLVITRLQFLVVVQVFGCPYLEYINIHVQILVLATDLWLSTDNCISIFGCPVNFLVVSGARTTKVLNAAIQLWLLLLLPVHSFNFSLLYVSMVTACDAYYDTDNQLVNSENYPANYSANLDCVYTFNSTGEGIELCILLQFLEVDMDPANDDGECEDDYLEVGIRGGHRQFVSYRTSWAKINGDIGTSRYKPN